MRTLTTPLCTLEPQVAAHAAEMFVVLSDPAIYEFENEPPRSAAWLHDRFVKLETRLSKDGSEQWLNWVLRLPGGDLAGYTQASVDATGRACIAYELGSRYWRRGLASSAVRAMMAELAGAHGAHTFVAVLKARNFRSRALLDHLGFSPADAALTAEVGAEADELVLHFSAARLRQQRALAHSAPGRPGV